MSRRTSMRDLRRHVMGELRTNRWMTVSQVADGLSVGHGTGCYRVALTLERLANDGRIEFTGHGTSHRFRRRQ
jgi:hypothetical protein